MEPTAVTRRSFLVTSAGAAAAVAVVAVPVAARADSRPVPIGVVSGRAGRRGLAAGTNSKPSRGEVILLDGRVLEASHVHRHDILPGRSVVLSSGESGGWTVLYAEY